MVAAALSPGLGASSRGAPIAGPHEPPPRALFSCQRQPLASLSLQCRPSSPPHAQRQPTEQPGQQLLKLQRVDAPDDGRAGLVWCFLSFPRPTILCDFKMTVRSLHFTSIYSTFWWCLGIQILGTNSIQ